MTKANKNNQQFCLYQMHLGLIMKQANTSVTAVSEAELDVVKTVTGEMFLKKR